MTLNEILQAIIDGKSLQIISHGAVIDIHHGNQFYYLHSEPLKNFRIKPETVTINGFEVPAPLKKLPQGQLFYAESPHDLIYVESYRGNVSSEWEDRALSRGLIHATAENAIMSCKARLGIDPYKD